MTTMMRAYRRDLLREMRRRRPVLTDAWTRAFWIVLQQPAAFARPKSGEKKLLPQASLPF